MINAVVGVKRHWLQKTILKRQAGLELKNSNKNFTWSSVQCLDKFRNMLKLERQVNEFRMPDF